MAICGCGCGGTIPDYYRGRARQFMHGHNTRGRNLRTARQRRPLLERMLEKIEPEPMSGCWIWTGARQVRGYGVVGSGGKYGVVRAHVAAYRLLRGAIPSGLVLDHTCRLTACVNPDHLEAVTQGENIRRARAFKS